MRGDYLDVGVVKNSVVATGRDSANEFRLSMFTGQLGHIIDIPPPPPPGLTALGGAARVGVGEDFVFDVDGDGNLGPAEDADSDPTTARQELFDLAIVSSGPLSTGCPGDAPPCGELYIVDLSSKTNLAHANTLRILDVIPLPGMPFSVRSIRRRAWRTWRFAAAASQSSISTISTRNHPRFSPVRWGSPIATAMASTIVSSDDVPTGCRPERHLDARLVMPPRGVFLSGSTTDGVQITSVSNQANELALDFNDPPPASRPLLGGGQKKNRLKGVVDGAGNTSATRLDAAWATVRVPTDPVALPIYVLEQGSGSCFWRTVGDPTSVCRAFHAGLSDHDIEFFVPQALVVNAQDILDNYREGPNHPSAIDTFGDLSMFAMPREPFINAELLNGTPLYRTGDTSGDLGMGRQTLLLLWLLEGRYIPGYEGPELSTILASLKAKPASANPIFPKNEETGEVEPSGIPRVEGYEWARLQEFNFYKTGAPLRIVGECDQSLSVSPGALGRRSNRSRERPRFELQRSQPARQRMQGYDPRRREGGDSRSARPDRRRPRRQSAGSSDRPTRPGRSRGVRTNGLLQSRPPAIRPVDRESFWQRSGSIHAAHARMRQLRGIHRDCRAEDRATRPVDLRREQARVNHPVLVRKGGLRRCRQHAASDTGRVMLTRSVACCSESVRAMAFRAETPFTRLKD